MTGPGRRFDPAELRGAGADLSDTEYADLTLAMRTGENPGKVFDALLARGQIRLHPDPGALRETLAAAAAFSYAAGERVAVVVATREQAAALQAEHISINRIAALFGVTRQRISALLRENGQEPTDRDPEDEVRP